jgi:replicative DNA helicase
LCNSILEDGKNNVPVLFFEKEMNYQSLVERLVAIDSGVSIQNIRLGILDKKQVDKIGESMRKIREYPIFIDTTFNSDIHYLESTIYKYKATKNIGVVYLDYLQLMAERDDNQTHELGRISRACKLLANDQGICIIGASQLNRGVEMRDNKRPMMSDLRQSGNLEEDADFVVALYRDEYYDKETKYKNLMEFIILKARNGPVGTITLKFDPESNIITNK